MEEFKNGFPYERVVVTGGAGFLGRFVVARLQQHGNLNVFAPRRADYDLVNGSDTKRLLTETRPDLVIHLAAVVGGIGANQKQPGRFFYENLMMGAQLIEQSRLHGVKKLVALGTVCAYPKLTATPFREEDLWNGYPEKTNAPYGLAKKMMLVQSQSYRQQYGFNTIFLLPANLYGPGDNFNPETSHVIPALIRKCIEARERGAEFVEAWGTGHASREFLYVADCADGVLRAAASYNESEPVNLGTGSEITISALVQLIGRLTRFGGEVRWQHDKPDGQPRRRLDVSRAFEKFGFQAQMPLEEGLRRTVEWYETRRATSDRKDISPETKTNLQSSPKS
ncbi:MAG: GDP-L-fucose synthase [Pyrinomonadaceae bacterium]|nr:GDP-L-fucose synthase [Pyrinomonadaceae bacterium]